MFVQQSKIELCNVTKKFGELEVLKNINATFEQAKTYSITGISGTGKSTLLHIIAGIDFPTSGKVLFDGTDISVFDMQQRELFLSKNLGLIFQEPCLIQEMTVLENVMLKGLIARDSLQECKKIGMDLLRTIGLKDKASNYPYQLSGGEQQRVSVLRAVFNKPTFILADEPTGNLDKQNAEMVTQLLIDCSKHYKSGLIVSTHDMHVAQAMQVVLTIEDKKLSLKN